MENWRLISLSIVSEKCYGSGAASISTVLLQTAPTDYPQHSPAIPEGFSSHRGPERNSLSVYAQGFAPALTACHPEFACNHRSPDLAFSNYTGSSAGRMTIDIVLTNFRGREMYTFLGPARK